MRLAISHCAICRSVRGRGPPRDPGTLATAAGLAVDLGHPLKDCIYLALAIELECELVTADARFAEKAKGVWDKVRVLGE